MKREKEKEKIFSPLAFATLTQYKEGSPEIESAPQKMGEERNSKEIIKK